MIYILSKYSDDKGTQLEALTRTLLSSMGYTNIVRNFISAGGEEIDVNADFALPGIGSTQFRRLICECKAHEKPVDLPQWLKFLGKVLFEEARLGTEISACFIALSGVNGNFAAHYDELKSHRLNITLVDGDILLSEVTKIYNLSNVEKANETLHQFTKRQYRSLEVAYYQNKVYWLVVFEDDSYTILDAQGALLEGDHLDVLKPLVEDAVASRPYVDLRAEAEAQKRAIQAQKLILAKVMINNGAIRKAEFVENEFHFTDQEFNSAIRELEKHNWIFLSEDNEQILFHTENDEHFYSRLAEVYRFLLQGEARFGLFQLFASDFHITHVNTSLVAEIQKIQGNFPLASRDIEVAIKLLRWSPSALLWSVQPDPMIVTHRTEQSFINDEQADNFDRNYFFRVLYGSLRNDFLHLPPRAYFLDVCGLKEIETIQKVIVKSKIGVELQGELRERIGLGELAEPYRSPDGSKYILLQILENAPQPWEDPVKEGIEPIADEQQRE